MKRLLFFFKNQIFRPRAIQVFRNLKESQYYNAEQLHRFQLNKLKRLLSHAVINSEFYRDKYKNNEVNISHISDFQRLPILSRAEVKNSSHQMIAEIDLKRVSRRITTGGSSGDPLEVYHDIRYPIDTFAWRVLQWWGGDQSNNIAFIYREVRTGWRKILNSMIWLPTRRIFLDASLLTEKKMGVFSKKINRVRPPTLQGYVSGVLQYARFCEKENIKHDFLNCVWVTAAPLSEADRRYMERIFGCSVYDQYGCSEVFWISAECEMQDGLHIMAEARYVEIVDENDLPVKVGDYGDIVITDLENYFHPLIRYRNGDRGRLISGDCKCGVMLPRMDKVKGRISDVVRVPSGAVIAGEYLTTIFDDAPDAVKCFQLQQKKDYSISLVCVLGNGDDALEICNVKVHELERLTGNEIKVSLSIVEKIDHDRGKTRFILSDLN